MPRPLILCNFLLFHDFLGLVSFCVYVQEFLKFWSCSLIFFFMCACMCYCPDLILQPWDSFPCLVLSAQETVWLTHSFIFKISVWFFFSDSIFLVIFSSIFIFFSKLLNLSSTLVTFWSMCLVNFLSLFSRSLITFSVYFSPPFGHWAFTFLKNYI